MSWKLEAGTAAADAGAADSAMPSIAGTPAVERGLFEPAGRVPERAGGPRRAEYPQGEPPEAATGARAAGIGNWKLEAGSWIQGAREASAAEAWMGVVSGFRIGAAHRPE